HQRRAGWLRDDVVRLRHDDDRPMGERGGGRMTRGRVVTVLGEIEPEDMGVTLSHDHILVDGWGLRQLYEAILDDESIALAELIRYREAGGQTICDPTNIGLGRNPEALARLSRASGVNIVMGAGWYREVVYPTL